MAYSKEDKERIFIEVCSQIEIGRSVNEILSQDNMPNRDTFYEWMRNDKDLSDKYARSMDIRADYYFDEMLKVAYTTEEGESTIDAPTGITVHKSDMIAHRRLKVDTLKWVVSRMNPKKYGDKMDVTSDGNELNSAPSKIVIVNTVPEMKELEG